MALLNSLGLYFTDYKRKRNVFKLWFFHIFCKGVLSQCKKIIEPQGNRVTLNDQKEKYAEDAFIMNEEKAIKKKSF